MDIDIDDGAVRRSWRVERSEMNSRDATKAYDKNYYSQEAVVLHAVWLSNSPGTQRESRSLKVIAFLDGSRR